MARVVLPALVVAALSCAMSCAQPDRPRFPARPPGCALEVVKTLPQRPYTEIETFTLPSLDSIREVLDAVQERACQDGADALYAPRAGRSYAYAIAVKWNAASGL